MMTADDKEVTSFVQPENHRGYTWEDKYQDISLVLPHEPLECYVQGGFHPPTLGDTFHGGRYAIKYKLGYGGYSTVWLAKDDSANRWTSLKIKQARVSPSILEDDKEVKALGLLEQNHTQ